MLTAGSGLLKRGLWVCENHDLQRDGTMQTIVHARSIRSYISSRGSSRRSSGVRTAESPRILRMCKLAATNPDERELADRPIKDATRAMTRCLVDPPPLLAGSEPPVRFIRHHQIRPSRSVSPAPVFLVTAISPPLLISAFSAPFLDREKPTHLPSIPSTPSSPTSQSTRIQVLSNSPSL